MVLVTWDAQNRLPYALKVPPQELLSKHRQQALEKHPATHTMLCLPKLALLFKACTSWATGDLVTVLRSVSDIEGEGCEIRNYL